jgi:hypothetical protein
MTVLGLAAGAGGRLWYSGGWEKENSRQAKSADAVGPVQPPAKDSPLAAGMLEDLLALPAFENRDRLVRWLAKAGTEEIADAAKIWKTSGERADPLTGDMIFLRWAELDPDAMLAFESGERAWKAWAHLNPDTALAAAQKKDASCARWVAESIAQSNPGAARALLAKQPELVDEATVSGIASGLARSDFRAAANTIIRADPDGKCGPVTDWAKAEPEEALAWARNLTSPVRRNRALELVIEAWAESCPERIEPAIRSFPPGTWRNGLVSKHAGRLAGADSQAALAWSRAVESPALRQSCTREIVKAVAYREPVLAEQLVREMDWDGGPFHGASGPALTALAEVAPERAMAVADSVPEQWRPGVRSLVFDTWLDNRYEEAASWLEAQPPEKRDAGCVGDLVYFLTEKPDAGFAAAYRWAVTLPPSPEPGDDQRSKVLTRWIKIDPAAAEQALNSPDLPEGVRAYFRRVQALEKGERPE